MAIRWCKFSAVDDLMPYSWTSGQALSPKSRPQPLREPPSRSKTSGCGPIHGSNIPSASPNYIHIPSRDPNTYPSKRLSISPSHLSPVHKKHSIHQHKQRAPPCRQFHPLYPAWSSPLQLRSPPVLAFEAELVLRMEFCEVGRPLLLRFVGVVVDCELGEGGG